MRESEAATDSRMAEVPSVEQSSTITSSRSSSGGSGAARTAAILRAASARSLYTHTRSDNSMRIVQYNGRAYPFAARLHARKGNHMKNATPRRDFLKGSGAAGAGLLITTSKIAFGSQANSALTLGLIGCGNRGMYVSGIFAKHEFL